MSEIRLNPVAIDSRFFEALKKLLELLLMILDYFDENASITAERAKDLENEVKGILKKDPELFTHARRAMGLVESAAALKPSPDITIVKPFTPPGRVS